LLVDSFSNELKELKESNDEKYNALEAKYNELKSSKVEPLGEDASLNGDEVKLTESQKAAREFVKNLSPSDKLLIK